MTKYREETLILAYQYLLFDLDHTLLDFAAAEEIALTQLLKEAQVPDLAAYKAYYIPMNKALWEDLAHQRISKAELINTRFAKLFAHFGQVVDGSYYAERYQHFLSQQGQLLPGAKELLLELKALGYQLFAATNGVTFIQKGRLQAAGLHTVFDAVFISDELGAQKPQKAYFEAIKAAIPALTFAQTLLIGDSLTADIQGGNNAGIDTVWYNPSQLTNQQTAAPTYTITNLRQLLPLLAKSASSKMK